MDIDAELAAPPPRAAAARFLKHPLLKRPDDAPLQAHEPTGIASPAPGSRGFTFAPPPWVDDRDPLEETRALLAHEIPMTRLPATARPAPARGAASPRSPSPTATLGPSSASSDPSRATHSTIPAASVFARNAPVLCLPALDAHIARIPAPHFKPYPSDAVPARRSKARRNAPAEPMFPPLGRLNASGQSIDDLETNLEVAPAWRNRNTLFGTLVDWSISITGSSAIATYYSLEGLVDTVQIFALILSTFVPHGNIGLLASWRQLFLGTIPNILALNLAESFDLSLIFLMLYMALAGLLLYYFHIATAFTRTKDIVEGMQYPRAGSGWGLLIVSFVLTALYLPLSTIAVHALVWSEDFWVVPNPYINATTQPPSVPPLGPASEFRPPMDFCYTTTMKLTEVNAAPLVVIMAAFVFAFMTIWYPLRLRSVIQASVPIVDPFTELGKKRSGPDLDREYQRLLARDKSAVSFLYSDFRRGWGTYKATYMFAKLSALLIVAVIDPDNCLFRTVSRTTVGIVRQSLLLAAMVAFLVLQCVLAPFLNPVNNASEVTSRINYVLTAAIGLGVAASVPGASILDGPVLYVVYGITYGLSAYFTIVNWTWMSRLVKIATRRIDFSLDIFSPKLDVSPTSPHLKRRIWQEALSILFLTSPECKIPEKQIMVYAQAHDDEYPPYLLDFQGSPAERYVENLKVLREVGFLSYRRAAALSTGPDRGRLENLQQLIQSYFVGPDSYWKPPDEGLKSRGSTHWGNAWWIPFPPTLVIRYDDGPMVVLQELHMLDIYVVQNSSGHVQRRREVRMAIRALDGHIVNWPHIHRHLIGATEQLCCGGRRFKAETAVQYYQCVLQIKRQGNLVWKGLQLGSGFQVQLVYAKDVHLDGGPIGLTDDYDLTSTLARFLSMNHRAIRERIHHIASTLDDYRAEALRQNQKKAVVLSYQFLTAVYEHPDRPHRLSELVARDEQDLRVRELIAGNTLAIDATYERLSAVAFSELAAWWYIFWDDFWRRNSAAIQPLRVHSTDFDPRFPTSLAYHPLPRPALESFLLQRGLMSKKPKWNDWVSSGLLNKMYFRMNDIAFRATEQAILVHLGSRDSEDDLEDLELLTQGRPSTLGTGPGDEHEDTIRPRPAFRWEGLLNDPLTKHTSPHRRWLAKVPTWFGITPVWRSGTPSHGVSLDVRLEQGRFVLARPVTKRWSYPHKDTDVTV